MTIFKEENIELGSYAFIYHLFKKDNQEKEEVPDKWCNSGIESNLYKRHVLFGNLNSAFLPKKEN